MGSAITTVAAALQVYALSHSALAVGAISITEAIPMVAGMLVGGALADAFDRRLLILASQVSAGACLIGLAANAASGRPRIWVLYLLIAASGAVLGLGAPARSAALPALVPPQLLPAAITLNSMIYQGAALIGPALAGLVVARYGYASAYGVDAASFLAYTAAAAAMRPLPPGAGATRPGLRSFLEGLGYLGRRSMLIGLLLIDVDAMVFGMPRALFPALGNGTFHAGAVGVGLLYAAPAAGAIIGAATSGWISRLHRAGLVLISSVLVWGAAITGFGLTRILPVALGLLVLAGAADLVSEVLRSTLLQLSIPDGLRGRLSALWLAQANGAPALGNLRAGAVASVATPAVSVVSGGLACILGVLLLCRYLPTLRTARFHPATAEPQAPHAP